MRINGISALVTGASSGLGRATATRLVKEGASVVLVDLPSSEGARVAGELGDSATFMPADVTDAAALEAAMDAAVSRGPLRAVVHCAGRGGDRLRILDKERKPADIDTFTEVIRVNLIGTYNMLRLAASRMAGNELLDGDRGAIVMTASVAAFDGQIGQTSYTASKAGGARDHAGRRPRLGVVSNSGQHHRARHFRHRDALAVARRHPPEPGRGDSASQAPRRRRRLRAPRRQPDREPVRQRRDDPARRCAADGAEITGITDVV